MANKISTKSYCVKRLKDSGFAIDKLDSVIYTETDKRKWSLLIDSGHCSIILTCYKDGKVHLYDGDRFLNSRLLLDTDSVEVIIEYLNEKGIINKHFSYHLKPTIVENEED